MIGLTLNNVGQIGKRNDYGQIRDAACLHNRVLCDILGLSRCITIGAPFPQDKSVWGHTGGRRKQYMPYKCRYI